MHPVSWDGLGLWGEVKVTCLTLHVRRMVFIGSAQRTTPVHVSATLILATGSSGRAIISSHISSTLSTMFRT